MLKQRVKRIEKGLGDLKIDKNNIEAIYQFYVTGDESFLPEQPKLREVYFAAKKTKKKGLNYHLGLQRVFKALKQEDQLKIESEDNLFDFLRNMKRPYYKILWPYGKEKIKEPDPILLRLGLIKLMIIGLGVKKTQEDKQD